MNTGNVKNELTLFVEEKRQPTEHQVTQIYASTTPTLAVSTSPSISQSLTQPRSRTAIALDHSEHLCLDDKQVGSHRGRSSSICTYSKTTFHSSTSILSLSLLKRSSRRSQSEPRKEKTEEVSHDYFELEESNKSNIASASHDFHPKADSDLQTTMGRTSRKLQKDSGAISTTRLLRDIQSKDLLENEKMELSAAKSLAKREEYIWCMKAARDPKNPNPLHLVDFQNTPQALGIPECLASVQEVVCRHVQGNENTRSRLKPIDTISWKGLFEEILTCLKEKLENILGIEIPKQIIEAAAEYSRINVDIFEGTIGCSTEVTQFCGTLYGTNQTECSLSKRVELQFKLKLTISISSGIYAIVTPEVLKIHFIKATPNDEKKITDFIDRHIRRTHLEYLLFNSLQAHKGLTRGLEFLGDMRGDSTAPERFRLKYVREKQKEDAVMQLYKSRLIKESKSLIKTTKR